MHLRRLSGALVVAARESLFDALLPPRCIACDAALPARRPIGVCKSCEELLTRNDGERCGICDLPGHAMTCPACRREAPPFTRLWAPFLYGGELAKLVAAAKFSFREDVAVALGHLLAVALADVDLGDATAVVPVPLGRQRRRRRGFNQSTVLAGVLARQRHLPVLHALSRRRETRPQSDLPLAKRRDNVEQAFVARRQCAGQLLLVDDVVTSGETVRQAASALLDAGAAQVRVVALARTPLD